jgi:hypothetical protein
MIQQYYCLTYLSNINSHGEHGYEITLADSLYSVVSVLARPKFARTSLQHSPVTINAVYVMPRSLLCGCNACIVQLSVTGRNTDEHTCGGRATGLAVPALVRLTAGSATVGPAASTHVPSPASAGCCCRSGTWLRAATALLIRSYKQGITGDHC